MSTISLAHHHTRNFILMGSEFSSHSITLNIAACYLLYKNCSTHKIYIKTFCSLVVPSFPLLCTLSSNPTHNKVTCSKWNPIKKKVPFSLKINLQKPFPAQVIFSNQPVWHVLRTFHKGLWDMITNYYSQSRYSFRQERCEAWNSHLQNCLRWYSSM